jgi:hypothetical protein
MFPRLAKKKRAVPDYSSVAARRLQMLYGNLAA